MKWRMPAAGLALVLLGYVLGAYIPASVNTGRMTGFVPSLRVIGDVDQPLALRTLQDFPAAGPTQTGGNGKAVPLAEIIQQARPVPGSYSILLVGDDGLTAEVEGISVGDCYITFSFDNGWEAINPKHPISSNIKRIKEVVVVSREDITHPGLGIINTAENIGIITPGRMFKEAVLDFPIFEGKSTVEHDGNANSVGIYTRRKMVAIKDLGYIPPEGRLLAMGKRGEHMTVEYGGYLEFRDNSIDYAFPGLGERIRDVAGIVVGAPVASIMDAYYDAAHFLDRDEDVLIIVLDGFGYHQYAHSIRQGYAPFLKSLAPADKALSVYRPVTNAGLAALLTGKPPAENGVVSRKERDVLVPSLFGLVEDMGKKGVMIEGNIKVLNLEIEPLLNIDRNSNGTIDDEITDAALQNMDRNYNLMVVHLHGIDDSGHSNGDLDPATMERIKVTDGYVNSLVSRWPGGVIITADHGMHSVPEGGEHGEFRYEDLIVPYIICKGEGVR